MGDGTTPESLPRPPSTLLKRKEVGGLQPCQMTLLRVEAPPVGLTADSSQRMFTARAEWPFDANPLFSNGVYGVRAVFCA